MKNLKKGLKNEENEGRDHVISWKNVMSVNEQRYTQTLEYKS